MTRKSLISLCLFALLTTFGASQLPLAAGPAGRDSRSGHITEIRTAKGGGRLAGASLEGAAKGPEGSTIYGGASMEVRPGMRVRLTVLMGTAVYSTPVGTVLEVSADGLDILFSVDESQMDTDLKDPTGGSTVRVKDLFRVGAEISVSR